MGIVNQSYFIFYYIFLVSNKCFYSTYYRESYVIGLKVDIDSPPPPFRFEVQWVQKNDFFVS